MERVEVGTEKVAPRWRRTPGPRARAGIDLGVGIEAEVIFLRSELEGEVFIPGGAEKGNVYEKELGRVSARFLLEMGALMGVLSPA